MRTFTKIYLFVSATGGYVYGKNNITFLSLDGSAAPSAAAPLLGALLGPILAPAVFVSELRGFRTDIVFGLRPRDRIVALQENRGLRMSLFAR